MKNITLLYVVFASTFMISCNSISTIIEQEEKHMQRRKEITPPPHFSKPSKELYNDIMETIISLEAAENILNSASDFPPSLETIGNDMLKSILSDAVNGKMEDIKKRSISDRVTIFLAENGTSLPQEEKDYWKNILNTLY